jgi:hypothetical protein
MIPVDSNIKTAARMFWINITISSDGKQFSITHFWTSSIFTLVFERCLML